MQNTDSSYPSSYILILLSYLSDAPHAAPHAAGFSSGLSDAPHAVPHAAGFSSGLSVAPHAVPHAAVASFFFPHPKRFDNAIFNFLL
jgi:hypothetical protein